jgi:Holliday junction DNA helicase RuvA
MIHYIKGTLELKLDDRVVVETGGIGFQIFVPSSSRLFTIEEGSEVKVFTAMIVKEDDMSLYGFLERQSLNMFMKLLTVSGIGAKAGLSLLSAISASELSKAIVFGDAAMLCRANGIGKKSAERIILELKDKTSIFNEVGVMNTFGGITAGFAANEPESEVIEVLMNLGYSRSEAASVVAAIPDKGESKTEELLKQALKALATI